MEVVDNFSIADLRRIKKPFIHSPIPGPTAPSTQSVWTSILGVREHPDLGILTSYFGTTSDVPIVERSWGLIGNGKVYGPNFRFSEYARTKSIFFGLFIHFVMTIGTVLLKLPMATWAMRKVIPPRGYGASEEETTGHFVEYRAVGRPNADTLARAHARVRHEGGLYECRHSNPASLVLWTRRMMAILLTECVANILLQCLVYWSLRLLFPS